MKKLENIRIHNHSHHLFKSCWELYQNAFPLEERRELEYHLEALKIKTLNFEAIVENNIPVGFISWWNINQYRYIEHFAITPSHRGLGYGKLALKEFILRNNQPIILEVEHPTNNINEKRIEFYQKLGFILNNHTYAHPPYHNNYDPYVSLLIMTYPKPINTTELIEFTKIAFPTVHFNHK